MKQFNHLSGLTAGVRIHVTATRSEELVACVDMAHVSCMLYVRLVCCCKASLLGSADNDSIVTHSQSIRPSRSVCRDATLSGFR